MIEATNAAVGTTLNTGSLNAESYNQQIEQSGQQFRNAVENAEHCAPGSSDHCMGSSILEGMQQLKVGYDEKVNAINDAVNVSQLTVQDVMSLQLEIAKLQMQEELMAKTASKTTQNVDTLLKSQ